MKILVVDDDESYLHVLGDLLREEGYEVFLCADGKEARELLDQQKVDVVISDVFMPNLDGCRFHSYVRELIRDETTPFIFVSGVEIDGEKYMAADPRKDFFVSKMAPIRDILNLIESLKEDSGPGVAPEVHRAD